MAADDRPDRQPRSINQAALVIHGLAPPTAQLDAIDAADADVNPVIVC